ncbi:MAG: protein kinase [Polyangiales bacterium]
MDESVRQPPEKQAAGGEALVRYEVLAEIGSGGMATVQYGRLHAPHGFVRRVAIKRLHPQFAKDPEFVDMFIDEARLSARLVHANIVATLDVVDAPDELALVMEYVHGESLWNLLRLSSQYEKPVPIRVATALTASVLYGLQAAHEAKNELGEPLGIVHRDVSPHNILVGEDGIPRLIDFGVAKAVGRLRSTPSGEIKGKLIYMSPEQLGTGPVDHRADVYGAAAVLWETLTGLSLFDGPNESAIMHGVLLGTIEPPGKHRREVTRELDAIVMKGLSREPSGRFGSAREMALALERDVGLASQSELAGWLQELAGGRLQERSRLIAELHERHPAGRSETRRAAGLASAGVVHDAATSSVVTAPAARSSRAQSWVRVGVALVAVLLTTGAYWLYARPAPASVVTPRSAPGLAPDGPPGPVDTATDSSAITGAPVLGAVHSASPDTAGEGINKEASPVAAEPVEPSVGPARTPRAPHKPTRTRGDTRVDETKSDTSDRSNCKNWFYVDEHGIRRPKPDCL